MANTLSEGFNIAFFDATRARRNFSFTKKYVVGYARLSFDEDGVNYVSIEHQKSILEEVYRQQYQDDTSEYTFIADDDISGYKFERPGLYKIASLIETGRCNIILAKDLSRIGRHGALTQLFIEQCEKVGIRISAMSDYDSNNERDDLILGIRAWSNERVVKDASAKALKVIRHKQKNGTWFCAAPFGYTIVNYRKAEVKIDEEAAGIVRRIFHMYLDGQGITAIARTLTREHVPTPNMIHRARALARGDECKRRISSDWLAANISVILSNEFYIGTLITGRYRRNGINGKDVRTGQELWNRFEHHHEPIIDEETFRAVQEIKASRGNCYHRPDNEEGHIFRGLVFCGDCGSVEFAYAPKRIATQYVCSAYFKHGKGRCSRHMVKEPLLIRIAIDFLKIARESCAESINSIDKESLGKYPLQDDRETLEKLKKNRDNIDSQLQMIEEQRIKQILSHPDREADLNQIYDNMAASALQSKNELTERIDKLSKVIASTADATRRARKAIAIIDKVIESGELTRSAAVAIFERITIYESGHIDIKLRPYLEVLEPQSYSIVEKVVKHHDEHHFITSNRPQTPDFPGINCNGEGDPSLSPFILTLTRIINLTDFARRLSL